MKAHRLKSSSSAALKDKTILFYKPFGVLSQFTPEPGSRWSCLADFIDVPMVYAAGRLDADSEGLLLLTDNGCIQQRLTDPQFGHWRRYWAQVEGRPEAMQLEQLRKGVLLRGQSTRPARVRWLQGEKEPSLPERIPPIRFRQSIPTHWLEISLREGRNRQVRKMTAAVGLPTLRLVRCSIDLMDDEPPLDLSGLNAGEWRWLTSHEEKRVAGLFSSRRIRRGARRPK